MISSESESLLDVAFVVAVHDEIILELGGLAGFASSGLGGVESALSRIETHVYYAGVDDVFCIAALYAVAISRGHVFNDANKRTGLTCALTYLDQQGLSIPAFAGLEEIMVDVAQGHIDEDTLANILFKLANI